MRARMQRVVWIGMVGVVGVIVWGGWACAWAQNGRADTGSGTQASTQSSKQSGTQAISTADSGPTDTTGSVRTDAALRSGEVHSSGRFGIDRIVLARTARIKPGHPLTLGDIAKLEGSQAGGPGGLGGRGGLGRLVVVAHPEAEPTDAGGWFSISLARVCSLLEAELGEGAAMIDCSGSSCDVQIVGGETDRHDQAFDNKKSKVALRVPTADVYAGQATVRGAIAREVARVLGVKTTDLRLTFADRDAAMLAIPTTGRVVEVSPTGSSDRMPILVAVYGPSGPIMRQTVRVEVQVRRVVAVVSREIARGSRLEHEAIVSGVRWFGPTVSTVEPEAALGSVARHRLLAGDVVESRDIEPPIVIHRGDLVSVRVSMQGVIVMREARALDAGRQGEEILFAAKKDPKQHFKAKVVGPGEAMIWGGLQRGMSLAKKAVQP